jgi:acyl carrier protein
VARGYLGRPALTAEKFVPNPFYDPSNPCSSRRLYRTGDLVRWLPDGNLEYLGRIDQQVKIRGFRVELGEIENRLLELASVKDAVVVALSGPQQEKRLVAYVVLADRSDGEAAAERTLQADLRRHLQANLPDNMVPELFVLLDRLPLTPNGKIDKPALPRPDFSVLQASYIPPATATEAQLCRIWEELLGIDTVGTEDNFFALGGHSLLATRLVARIKQLRQVELPLKEVFAKPQLSAMALAIEQLAATTSMTIVPVARDGWLPASFAQQRMWTLHQIDGGSVHYNMPVALRLHGAFDHGAAQGALRAILARHESLRTGLVSDHGAQLHQIVFADPAFSLDYVDLSTQDEATQDQTLGDLLREHALRPFDLAADLKIRACLLRLAPDQHVLSVVLHHIAADGWSMGILMREFCALYGAFAGGEALVLPALPVQYADYAHWQHSGLHRAQIEQQLGYWQDQLAGLPEVHSLPLDMPRPALQTFRGGRHSSTVSAAATAKLRALCQQEGGTLFMGLHAAFSVFLGRCSGAGDIVVGSSIANREQMEIAGLIGFFVNTIVLRARVEQTATFIDALRQSRATLLAAYANQQVPFQAVVERVQPRRSLAHTPLFQILLELHNNEMGQMALPGVDVAVVETAATGAKYDLSLNIVETAGDLHLSWEYNADLFLSETCRQMAQDFGRCVEQLVEHALLPMADLTWHAAPRARAAAGPEAFAVPAAPVQLTAPAAAAGEIERSLAGIWEQILGEEGSGADVNESFFELGGNSLMMIQLITRINLELGWKIPVKDAFESPTIRHLATLISLSSKTAQVTASVHQQLGEDEAEEVI